MPGRKGVFKLTVATVKSILTVLSNGSLQPNPSALRNDQQCHLTVSRWTVFEGKKVPFDQWVVVGQSQGHFHIPKKNFFRHIAPEVSFIPVQGYFGAAVGLSPV